jgi:Maf-like protein
MRQSPVRAMILEKVPALINRKIILASASPRRQELLKQIGLNYEVKIIFIIPITLWNTHF